MTRACELRLDHLERRERRRRLTRRLRGIHTRATSPVDRCSRSTRNTAGPAAASSKEAEHGGCDLRGRGLRVARLQIRVKVQDEEAKGLRDGQKRREHVDHGLVDALPQEGDVVGELGGAGGELAALRVDEGGALRWHLSREGLERAVYQKGGMSSGGSRRLGFEAPLRYRGRVFRVDLRRAGVHCRLAAPLFGVGQQVDSHIDTVIDEEL